MTEEKEAIVIKSISEPDEDGQINLEIDFNDEKLLKELQDIADRENKSLSLIIGEGLLDFIKDDLSEAEYEKAKLDLECYNPKED